MPRPFYKNTRITMPLDIKRQWPHPEKIEVDQQAQVTYEVWEQSVQQDALHEASHRDGAMTFGGIEIYLKRISEQITRAAQEKRSRDQPLSKDSTL